MATSGLDRLALPAGALALALVAWGLYGSHLDAPLVLDDEATILRNPSIEHLWPPADFVERDRPLTPPPGLPTSARPLVNLTFAFDHAWSGTTPTGYRRVNLAIHVATALLLWAVTAMTLSRDGNPARRRIVRAASFLAALGWMVHPVHSECVMYVTQRTESLMALCMLATLAAAIRFHGARGAARHAWLAVAAVAAAAGMLSKEVMAVAPLVVLLHERTFLADDGRIPAASLPLHAALAATLSWFPVAWLAGYRTPMSGVDVGITPVTWWCTQAKVLFLYLRMVVWPWPLSIHHHLPLLDDPRAALPWVLAAGALAVMAVHLAWRRHPAGFVAVTALSLLAPTSLVPLFDEVAAERRLYLPLAVLAAGVAGAALAAGRAGRGRASPGRGAALALAAVAVAVVLAGVTVARLRVYRTSVGLWADAVTRQPDNYLARCNLARHLVAAGRRDEAKVHWAHAAALPPPSPRHHEHHAAASLQLATLLHEEGETARAIPHYRRAAELAPGVVDIRYNLAAALAEEGDDDGAVAEYRVVVGIRPDHFWGHTNLGILLASGDPEAALGHLEAAHRIDPGFRSCANLAALHRATGRIDEAVALAREALRAPHGPEDDAVAAALEALLEAVTPASGG